MNWRKEANEGQRSLGLDTEKDPPSKSVVLKNDLLIVLQKRHFRLDTKSKHSTTTVKNSHIGED
jgi:hypothetical protein